MGTTERDATTPNWPRRYSRPSARPGDVVVMTREREERPLVPWPRK
jgi:hypothetical protein